MRDVCPWQVTAILLACAAAGAAAEREIPFVEALDAAANPLLQHHSEGAGPESSDPSAEMCPSG